MKLDDETPNLNSTAAHRIDGQLYPEVVSGIYTLFNVLSFHDKANDAVEIRIQYLRKILENICEISQSSALTILTRGGMFVIQNQPVQNHFSFTEAYEGLLKAFHKAFIVSLTIQRNISDDSLQQFLVALYSHTARRRYPQKIQTTVDGIELAYEDWRAFSPKALYYERLGDPYTTLQSYFVFRKNIEEFFQSFSRDHVISQSKIRFALSVLSDLKERSPHQLVALSSIRAEEGQGGGLIEHVSEAAATGLLSMLVAHELKLTCRDQINIGGMGILYNIGLLGKEVLAFLKNESLSPTEYKQVIDAQVSGVWKLMLSEGINRSTLEKMPSILKAVSKTKSDGFESQVLKLVSQYIALTSERPFREPYSPYEALKILGKKVAEEGEKNADLHPLIFYVFVRTIGHYPIGSLVLLSNDKKAVVFKARGEKPGVPVLKILPADAKDKTELLDLATAPDLKITSALNSRREGINPLAFLFEK